MQGKAQKTIPQAIAGTSLPWPRSKTWLSATRWLPLSMLPSCRLPVYPTPMFGLAVEPKSRGDEQKISQSLQKIADEDATFKITRDMQTRKWSSRHESAASGCDPAAVCGGASILKSSPRNRRSLIAKPSRPRRKIQHRHKKQNGGRGQFGEVHLRVYPLPREITTEEQLLEEYANKSRFEKMRMRTTIPNLQLRVHRYGRRRHDS